MVVGVSVDFKSESMVSSRRVPEQAFRLALIFAANQNQMLMDYFVKDVPSNWSPYELYEKLRLRFGVPQSREEMIRVLRSLSSYPPPGTSFSSYKDFARAIRSLVQRVYKYFASFQELQEFVMLDIFWRSVSEDAAHTVRLAFLQSMHNGVVPTVEQVAEMCGEGFITPSSSQSSSQHALVVGTHTLPQPSAGGSAAPARKGSKGPTGGRRSSDNGDNIMRIKNKNYKCWVCGGTGHFHQGCPFKNKDRSSIQCKKCKEFGHTAPQCDIFKRDYKKTFKKGLQVGAQRAFAAMSAQVDPSKYAAQLGLPATPTTAPTVSASSNPRPTKFSPSGTARAMHTALQPSLDVDQFVDSVFQELFPDSSQHAFMLTTEQLQGFGFPDTEYSFALSQDGTYFVPDAETLADPGKDTMAYLFRLRDLSEDALGGPQVRTFRDRARDHQGPATLMTRGETPPLW